MSDILFEGQSDIVECDRALALYQRRGHCSKTSPSRTTASNATIPTASAARSIQNLGASRQRAYPQRHDPQLRLRHGVFPRPAEIAGLDADHDRQPDVQQRHDRRPSRPARLDDLGAKDPFHRKTSVSNDKTTLHTSAPASVVGSRIGRRIRGSHERRAPAGRTLQSITATSPARRMAPWTLR